MSQLGVILQESLRAETEARTILGLLTHRMDGGQRRRRTLKERLRFTGMGCCGATWVFRPAALTFRHAQEQEQAQGTETAAAAAPPPLPAGGGTPLPHHHHQQQQLETSPGQDPNLSGPECVRPSTSGSGMNLAAALAAERQMRGPHEADAGGEGSGGGGGGDDGSGTPWRVSLMRLLEETEGGGGGGGGGADSEGVGNDWVCCVCMGRKKGAAFIPCGHTFCRVCSREVWLNRGTCPLCNRPILEILDIF